MTMMLMNTLLRSSALKNYATAVSSTTPAAAAVATANILSLWLPSTHQSQQQQQQRAKHTVRVIVKEDLPEGQAYAGDVVHVAAGFARNYLIPQRLALYATRQNFAKLNMSDPDLETAEDRQARLIREKLESEDKDLKAADLLKKYLRNKVLKIWRNADPATEEMRPGMVDAVAVRKKLSKQLKIDLEPHEKVHLLSEPVLHSDLTEEGTEELLKNNIEAADQPCTVQVRQLGEFLAGIALKGGFLVPLKVEVLKR